MTVIRDNLKLFAFTLDLEAEYGGVLNNYEIFNNHEQIEKVLSTLDSLGVKTTVFIVGKIFELFPDVIGLFQKYNCEFEIHSYSHSFNSPDTEFEIEQSKLAYLNYFGKPPTGYRAPRGKISHAGFSLLKKHGFLYDSSIFPSYFPNPFRYLFCNKQAHYYNDSEIMEIPFTSVSPFRLILSVSYLKFIGINFFMAQSLPDIICFDSHLHDMIVNKSSFGKLPWIWKLVYSRNKYKGMDYCVQFLKAVKEKGYQFCYMSELYNYHKEQLS
jgi:peptidoglycan/xylan/chitin deacetylase (PgdA/CDA1 family)